MRLGLLSRPSWFGFAHHEGLQRNRASAGGRGLGVAGAAGEAWFSGAASGRVEGGRGCAGGYQAGLMRVSPRYHDGIMGETQAGADARTGAEGAEKRVQPVGREVFPRGADKRLGQDEAPAALGLALAHPGDVERAIAPELDEHLPAPLLGQEMKGRPETDEAHPQHRPEDDRHKSMRLPDLVWCEDNHGRECRGGVAGGGWIGFTGPGGKHSGCSNPPSHRRVGSMAVENTPAINAPSASETRSDAEQRPSCGAELSCFVQLKLKGIIYSLLVERRGTIGVCEKEANTRNKLNRGKFSAAFLLQCWEAIGATSLSLDV